MNDDYFKYRFNELVSFNVKENEFVTILGNNNDLIIRTLLYTIKKGNIFIGDQELNDNSLNIVRRRMSFVLYKHLNLFVGETVKDEIAFGLESLALRKYDIDTLISREARNFDITSLLEKDPNSLGSSDKTKMKILSSVIIKPKILILDNVFSELDYNDRIRVIDLLKEYVKFGGIVINFTNNVEESLYGSRIIIINDKKLVCDGKTLSVLNETEILNKLGIGIPFLTDVNKRLIEENILDKYYLSDRSLVGAIWK